MSAILKAALGALFGELFSVFAEWRRESQLKQLGRLEQKDAQRDAREARRKASRKYGAGVRTPDDAYRLFDEQRDSYSDAADR